MPLLDYFSMQPASIDELHQRWALEKAISIYGELQEAIRIFESQTPEESLETQNFRDDLITQSIPIIRGLDNQMRLSVFRRAINDIGSWLDEARGATDWNSADEATRLVEQPAHIVACCIIKTDPLLSFALEGTRPCIFMHVSEMGANLIVSDMIHELKLHLGKQYKDEELKSRLYGELNKTDGSKNTALALAVARGHFKTMATLLKWEPRLADYTPFLSVIFERDNVKGFKELIKYKAGLINSKNLREAIACGFARDVAERTHEIIELLLQKDPSLIDNETARLIVDTDDPKLWESVKEYCHPCFTRPSCTILHDAVYSRRVDIVEYVIQKAPDLSTASRKRNYAADDEIPQKSRYALWYNCKERSATDAKAGSDAHELIRNLIIPAVIRSAEPFMIRRIFRESNAENICLPLSSFNTSAHDFMLYVHRLIEKSEEYEQTLTGEATPIVNGISHDHPRLEENGSQRRVPDNRARPSKLKAIKFEEVLRYADFPDLNSTFPCTFDDYRKDYYEVSDVLRWLSTKGVKEIVEVKVLDRLNTPHDDNVVKYCVQEFKVRTLDWRKLDLCLADLDPRETLKTLHLYTSGNMAVIHNWLARTDNGGIKRLRNLEALHVHIVQDVLSDKRADALERLCQSEFGKLRDELSWKNEVHVCKERWRKEKVEERAKDLKEIVEKSFPYLVPFLEKYKNEHRSRDRQHSATPPRRSKVCLIDSGVVVVENNTTEKLHIGAQIVDGQSFVYEDSSESPWWHASVSHGTQMASLICSIDPCCELYVTKVGDDVGMYGDRQNVPVTPERVADAVEWAIDKEVDVIVFCLVMGRTIDELERAFKKAHEKNIVVICSTSDAGRNWTDTWPTKYAHHKDSSGFDNIIGIGACDKEGFRLGYTQDSDFPFLFLGKDVYVGPIPFVKSEDYVNGSSVATAIAAGVASLTLSCHRLENNHAVLEGKGKYITVRKKFERMAFSASSSAEPRYVLLQRFVSEPLKRLFEETFSASSNIANALTREFGASANL